MRIEPDHGQPTFRVDWGAFGIELRVETRGRTGVRVEAVAAQGAMPLIVHDTCKVANRVAQIGEGHVIEETRSVFWALRRRARSTRGRAVRTASERRYRLDPPSMHHQFHMVPSSRRFTGKADGLYG